MLQLFPVLNYQLKNKRELTCHEYRHEWRKVIEHDDVMGVVRPVLVAQVVAFIASVLLFSGKIAIGYLAIDRVGKVGVSEANRDGFEGKRPSP